MKLWVLIWTCFTMGCTVLQNPGFVLDNSLFTSDSLVLYSLPFQKGKTVCVVQGYRSQLSHKGDYAIDFAVPEGTPICAARSGTVFQVRDSFAVGGISRKYVGTGNGLTIKHNDGTYAHYWHLSYKSVLVNVGDTVQRGQCIALSGDTGFSAFPHLHFEVTHQPRISRKDIPVIFKTTKGAKFLKPLRCYKVI